MSPYLYMRHLAVAPLTLLMYIWFAFAFSVYNSLPDGSFKKKAWYYGMGIPFFLADVLYNIFIGTFIFWELPRETVFTSRIIRHKEQGNHLAITFGEMLNIYDEGHVP